MYSQLKRLPFILLLWAVMTNVQALTITPTQTRYEAAGNRYYFTVNDWSPSDPSPSFCINPLRPESTEGCALSGALLRYPNDKTGWRGSVGITTHVENTKTMGDALKSLNRIGVYFPLNLSILVQRTQTPVPDTACLSLYASFSGFVSSTAFSPCVKPAPLTTQCDLGGENVIKYINSLSDDNVEGTKAFAWIKINCSAPTNLRVKAGYENSNGVSLGLGVTSTLSINGKDIGVIGSSLEGGIDLNQPTAGEYLYSVVSTLHTGGRIPSAGLMDGSTWIEIFIP